MFFLCNHWSLAVVIFNSVNQESQSSDCRLISSWETKSIKLGPHFKFKLAEVWMMMVMNWLSALYKFCLIIESLLSGSSEPFSIFAFVYSLVEKISCIFFISDNSKILIGLSLDNSDFMFAKIMRAWSIFWEKCDFLCKNVELSIIE